MPRVFYQKEVPTSNVYFPLTKWIDVSEKHSIGYGLKTDGVGTLSIEFSPDENNVDSTLTKDIDSGVREVHIFKRLNSFVRFKAVWTTTPSYFRLEVFNDDFSNLTSGLDSVIQQDSDAQVSRSVLLGQTDGGNYSNVPVTPEGHLEVAIHGPRLPFGSIHTENLKPVFQSDGVYGLNTFSMITSTGLSVGTGAGSGSVTASGNKLVCSTGATQYSFASLQSRRRLRYRAGQGVVGRFTALFSSPVSSGIQVAGLGTSETTLAFGYNGTSFGILYSTGGVREIHTFTVTTASTATNDYVVTLPNTATVNVTATNNSSTTQTAYEISRGAFPGWKASARGSTVIFVADSSGNKSGSFSLTQPSAGVPAAGSDAETLAGVASTDTWIPQASWNGDVCDGSGSSSNKSGFNLNPAYGNVYSITVQYLGFGPIEFKVEATSPDNNPEFITVHTIRYNNTSTSVSLSQPSFPFLAAASSAGSTSNISVSIGSFAGFNEGEIINLGPRVSYQLDSLITSSTTVYKPLFTIRNGFEWRGRVNQSVIRLLDISGSANGSANANTKFYLVRNPTLTGPVNFLSSGTNSSCYVDKGATGMSTPADADILWTRSVTTTGDFEYALSDREITLQPGESLALCVKSLTNTASCTGALNTREDQ